MPRVLITGGTGFLGQELAGRLLEAGYIVRIATRRQSVPEGLFSNAVEIAGGCDLTAQMDWKHALQGVDYVVHCAARVHVLNESEGDPAKAFFEQNVLATQNLASQAAAEGVSRFIFISSIGVNGNSTNRDAFKFDDRPAPTTAYAESKLSAEKILTDLSSATDMDVVSIRPPLIYGRNAPGNFVQLEKLIGKRAPLPFGLTRNKRNFVSVDNVVGFISHLLSCDRMKSGIFLVSDGEEVSTKQFVGAISEAKNIKPIFLPVPVKILKLMLGALGKYSLYEKLFGDLRIDIEYTKAQTGWYPERGTIESINRIFSDK